MLRQLELGQKIKVVDPKHKRLGERIFNLVSKYHILKLHTFRKYILEMILF